MVSPYSQPVLSSLSDYQGLSYHWAPGPGGTCILKTKGRILSSSASVNQSLKMFPRETATTVKIQADWKSESCSGRILVWDVVFREEDKIFWVFFNEEPIDNLKRLRYLKTAIYQLHMILSTVYKAMLSWAFINCGIHISYIGIIFFFLALGVSTSHVNSGYPNWFSTTQLSPFPKVTDV